MGKIKKRNKENQKLMLYFFLFQLIFCIPCFLLYDAAKIATEKNTQVAVFYADSVDIAVKPIGDNRRIITVWHGADAYSYYFSNDIIKNETNLELMRTQQLTIRYFPKNGTIVDIYGEEKEFYSMDSYNEARKGERIGILCSFVILETVWGIALFGFTLTTPRGYKLFCKIKRRCQSGDGSVIDKDGCL